MSVPISHLLFYEWFSLQLYGNMVCFVQLTLCASYICVVYIFFLFGLIGFEYSSRHKEFTWIGNEFWRFWPLKMFINFSYVINSSQLYYIPAWNNFVNSKLLSIWNNFGTSHVLIALFTPQLVVSLVLRISY